MTMSLYTVWTMEQITSARKVIAALDDHRRMQRDATVKRDPMPVAGEVLRVTDDSGTAHDIYMTGPTHEQWMHPYTTPLPAEEPSAPGQFHPSHKITHWQGFRELHSKCAVCGCRALSDLKLECDPCA